MMMIILLYSRLWQMKTLTYLSMYLIERVMYNTLYSNCAPTKYNTYEVEEHSWRETPAHGGTQYSYPGTSYPHGWGRVLRGGRAANIKN